MHPGPNSVSFFLSVTFFVYTVLLAHIFSLNLATLLELQFLVAVLAVTAFHTPYNVCVVITIME